MVNAANQLVQIPIRSTAPFYTEMAISAAGWREQGLDVQEETAPPGNDAEYRAKFPGVTATARGTGDGILTNFDSRAIPRPSNLYTGQNLGAYASPAMDRLIDELSVTLDEAGQGRVLAGIADILVGDLPALPIYSRVEMVAKVKGIKALDDDYAGADNGTIARHAHLWDRD